MESESPSSHILSTAAQDSPESSATGEVIDAPQHPFWCYLCTEIVLAEPERSGDNLEMVCYDCHFGFIEAMTIGGEWEAGGEEDGNIENRDDDGGEWEAGGEQDGNIENRDDIDGGEWEAGGEEDGNIENRDDDGGEWEAGGEEDGNIENRDDDGGEWEAGGEEDGNIENGEGTGETREASRRNGPFYAGNPGDYLDARGFELLLQHLAETENSGRGAPPAAQSVIEQLPLTVIRQAHEEDGSSVCTICQDSFALGDQAKQLPCMHLYHPDCILPWLCAKNSCPVCRYELPTDDPEYEEEKGNAGRRTNNNYHGQNFNQENSSELSADTQDLENAVLEQQPDAENLLGASRTLGNRSVADRFADLLAEIGRTNY